MGMSLKKNSKNFDEVPNQLIGNILNQYGVKCEDESVHQIITNTSINYISRIIKESSRIAKLRHNFYHDLTSQTKSSQLINEQVLDTTPVLKSEDIKGVRVE